MATGKKVNGRFTDVGMIDYADNNGTFIMFFFFFLSLMSYIAMKLR